MAILERRKDTVLLGKPTVDLNMPESSERDKIAECSELLSLVSWGVVPDILLP